MKIKNVLLPYTAPLILAFLLLAGSVFALPPGKMMHDPFLWLGFPAETNVYERVPREDYEKYGLRDGPHWIFASYVDEEEGAHYLVTSGFITAWLDTEPPTPAGLKIDFGVLLKGKEGGYEILGAADWITASVEELSKKTINGILDDFVLRSLKGFGEVENLQALINSGNNHPKIEPHLAEALGRAGVVVPETMILLEKWRKGIFFEIPAKPPLENNESRGLMGYKPEKGDIVIFQPYEEDGIGHIQMYNGKNWVSDFRQKGRFYPGQGYQDNNVRFEIYRYKSTNNPADGKE